MSALLHPTPNASQMDVADVFAAHTKLRGDLALRQPAAKRADFMNLGFRQLAASHPFASVRRAVQHSVSLIFDSRFPRQMLFRNASSASLTARVSGFVNGGWRGAVYQFADAMMDVLVSAFVPHVAIPSSEGEWPSGAFVPLIGHDDIAEVAGRLAGTGAASKRVAVFAPSLPVSTAPAARFERLVATRNRAYSLGSHVEPPMLPWLERAAVVTHPARLSSSTTQPFARQRRTS